jgi:[ribosomal protein S18]-alanine N-acetyltransferase
MNQTLAVMVEPMRLDDIEAVLDIDRLSFPLPWSTSSYRYELTQNTHSYFFVALAPQSGAAGPRGGWRERLSGLLKASPEPPPAPRLVVGYAGFWYIVDEAHISTIAVHPDWRGQGAGEQLLVGLLERALDLNAVKATLEVRVTNTRAQNLYRKYGFEEVGRRRRYYRDNGEDALLMTAELHAGYRDEMRRSAQARGGGSRPAGKGAGNTA